MIILPLLPRDGTALDLLTDLTVKWPYIQLATLAPARKLYIQLYVEVELKWG